MYAQAAIKPNTILRNGAYGIVMRGVQKCTRGCSSLRGRKRLPLCCIKLDTATDPCMGSGHILCYLFDVLVQIYEAYGYSVREAVRLIVEKNLYGLDLDERAGQLAYFAVMMKARQYDRRFFSRDVQPNIGHFQGFTPYRAEDFSDPALQSLVKAFENADEYGSLLEISEKSIDIETAANAVDAYTDDFLVGLDAREKLLRMVQLARMCWRRLNNREVTVWTPKKYNTTSPVDSRNRCRNSTSGALSYGRTRTGNLLINWTRFRLTA